MTNDTLSVRVTRKRTEAEDICLFQLEPVGCERLPEFEAGAHIDVHLPNRLVRQYSLCNSPEETDRYQICVLRDPDTRGGSQAMHDLVEEGDTLVIGKPRNLFRLVPGAHHSLLLAGGIGVTPLMAMAWRLAGMSASFAMHYFSRSRARTAFVEPLRSVPFKDRVSHWFDDTDAGQRPAIGSLLSAAPDNTHVYVCGPAGFLEHVRKTCEAMGWPAERMHYEAFTAQPVLGGSEFSVRIRSTGLTVPVPADKTIVEALDSHGIEIPVSCEQGICGTCVTSICDGMPDHRDQYLTDEERSQGKQFTPCCSRSLTPLLVLDL